MAQGYPHPLRWGGGGLSWVDILSKHNSYFLQSEAFCDCFHFLKGNFATSFVDESRCLTKRSETT